MKMSLTDCTTGRVSRWTRQCLSVGELGSVVYLPNRHVWSLCVVRTFQSCDVLEILGNPVIRFRIFRDLAISSEIVDAS